MRIIGVPNHRRTGYDRLNQVHFTLVLRGCRCTRNGRSSCDPCRSTCFVFEYATPRLSRTRWITRVRNPGARLTM